MEEGTIIAARILDGYYFYRVPANADGCTIWWRCRTMALCLARDILLSITVPRTGVVGW